MILYHGSTMYHLCCCIAHKLVYHQNEPARLLLLEYIAPAKQRTAFVERLRGMDIFCRIDVVPERKLQLSRGRMLTEGSSEKEIKEVLENLSNAFEKWFDGDVRSFREIYVAADVWTFGSYLLYKQIPYHYMEDASGMLSQQERYLRVVKGINMTNYVIGEYLKSAGRSMVVKTKLCDLANQEEGFFDPRAVDFSIYHALQYDVPEKRRELLKLYGVEKVAVQTNEFVCLLLTQSLKTLSIKDLNVQETITTLLVDYTCGDCQLIIKPHPKDQWINYHRVFPEALVLPNHFPSELLPFAMDAHVNLAVTASSTALGGVRSYTDSQYSFGTDIETNWEWLHSMYMAAKVLSKLRENYEIAFYNINEHQMSTMLEVEKVSLSGTKRAVIDGGFGKSRCEKTCDLEVSLSLGDVLNWKMYEDCSDVLVVTGRIIPLEESLLEEKSYVVFVKCKNPEEFSRLQGWTETRQLTYSKANLEIKAEKVTRGMVESFEIAVIRDIELTLT